MTVKDKKFCVRLWLLCLVVIRPIHTH